MVEIGQTASDFTLKDQDGQAVTLSQFRGKRVVVYFYPKDDTPGCTKQACSLRDHWSEIQARGAVVLGISAQSVASHKKFATKYQLPFPVLVDEDHAVSVAWGTWGEKSMYGKKVTGQLRTTFLVDEAGVVTHVWKKPKTDVHGSEVLERLG
jgi:peroxiredoxin Q/BCP